MLAKNLNAIYSKFKLYYYRRLFRKVRTSGKDSLTAIETFCAEAIFGLNRPTLSQFANFINVSQPNAAYKVANLERKGFVRRIKSTEDLRVSYLEVTDKYMDIYGSGDRRYAGIIARRIARRFPEEDVDKLNEILTVVSEELMREINRYLRNEPALDEETKIEMSVIPDPAEEAAPEEL